MESTQVAQKTYRFTIYLGHGHIIPPVKDSKVFLPDELYIDTVAQFAFPPPPLNSSLYELSRDRPTSIDLQPFIFPGSFDLKFGVHLSSGELEIIQQLTAKVKRDVNNERLGCYPVARFLNALREDLEKSPIQDYRNALNPLLNSILAECQNEKKRANKDDVVSTNDSKATEEFSSGVGMWCALLAT